MSGKKYQNQANKFATSLELISLKIMRKVKLVEKIKIKISKMKFSDMLHLDKSDIDEIEKVI